MNDCFLLDWATVIAWLIFSFTAIVISYLWYRVKMREIDELEEVEDEIV